MTLEFSSSYIIFFMNTVKIKFIVIVTSYCPCTYIKSKIKRYSEYLCIHCVVTSSFLNLNFKYADIFVLLQILCI